MLYELTVPTFKKALYNLLVLLNKGEEYAQSKKIPVEVLLNTRLAPDMFPLIRQVQISCDTAKLCVARLTAKEAPVHEDKEVTLPELKARIESVLSYLDSFHKNEFEGSDARRISQPRWEGKWLTGQEYVFHHALPNIYFHVSMAYAILRNNGVDVGKKDYLGELPFKK